MAAECIYVCVYLGVLHCHRDRGQVEVWSSWGTGGKVGKDTAGPLT